MQYCKPNRNGDCKIKTADFQRLSAEVATFSQLFIRAFVDYGRNPRQKRMATKIALESGYEFDNDICKMRIWRNTSSPQKLRLVEKLFDSDLLKNTTFSI